MERFQGRYSSFFNSTPCGKSLGSLMVSSSPPKKTLLSPTLALVYVERVEMKGNSRDELMELREQKVQIFQSA